jgi:hypothetical protein
LCDAHLTHSEQVAAKAGFNGAVADKSSMITQSSANLFACVPQREETSALRRIFPTKYPLCGNGTACDTARAFPIIPRISGAAESPPAPNFAAFPVNDGPGALEQNLRGLKMQRGEWE